MSKRPDCSTPRRGKLKDAMRLVTGPDEYGSVYVYFKPQIKDGEVAHCVPMKGQCDVVLDFDKKGRLLGIEILNVRETIKVKADE